MAFRVYKLHYVIIDLESNACTNKNLFIDVNFVYGCIQDLEVQLLN
jgi:hypothetical protein